MHTGVSASRRRIDRRRPIRLLAAPMLACILVLTTVACDSARPSPPGSTLATAVVGGPDASVDAEPGSPAVAGSPGPSIAAGSSGSVASASPPARPSPSPSPSPSVSPSATPVSGPSAPPTTAYDPAKFGFAAKGLRGEVMAFVTTSQVDDALARLDFAAVSTIAFFSLEASSTGAIRRDGRWRTWTSAQVDRLIERAHATGTKVVISLARFSWSPGQTTTSATLLAS
ncbi:MAG: hypothetical protein QOF49_1938, partial [Chloroflexota bacterium]|nr:hypothetical protein [Chloroflexota bacterium]